MPKFYLDTEEKGKGYIVGWMGRLQKTRDGQNNRKGGPAVSAPPIEGDDFSFAASGAVVQPSILQVQKPSDRLGDFTVVRGSNATYVDSSGVIQIAPDNVARIDYTNGVAELLTEPQSTNLYLQSGGSTVENTTVTATPYTVSFYGTGTLTFSGAYTGSLIGTGENERVSLTFTPTAGTLTSATSGTITYKQCENLPYATSAIITNGSTVTRLQDQITDGGNVNVINSEEGTMFFEGSALFDGNINRSITISDGTGNNRLWATYLSNGIQVQFAMIIGGVVSFSFIESISQDGINKCAIKWKENDFALWVNGVEVASESIGSTAASSVFNNINLSLHNNSEHFFGRTRELKVYSSALTDEELENITKQDIINPVL